MTGGLIQLVATGSQDLYLTGTPQISFFNSVYKCYTQFSIECIPQVLDGTADFGHKVSCIIPRNGDLIHKIYICIDLPELDDHDSSWVNNIGHFILNEVSIEIGGQIIDKHYGDWLNIWSQLTQPAEKSACYDKLIGSNLGYHGSKLYIPLQFWFCKHPGLALPLIALQYHEVKINIDFKNASDCYIGNASTPRLRNVSLLVDYIFLDIEERRQFAQNDHEYLIEQVQFSGNETYTTPNVICDLSFNHPCKEFIWVLQPISREISKQWYDYSLNGNDQQTIIDAYIRLNGHERFTKFDAEYFNLVQPFQHHTSIPSPGVYVYSFALHPEDHQPSGTINMSRIDNALLILSTRISGSYKLRVYATNYNILRISSGMGGVAFSN